MRVRSLRLGSRCRRPRRDRDQGSLRFPLWPRGPSSLHPSSGRRAWASAPALPGWASARVSASLGAPARPRPPPGSHSGSRRGGSGWHGGCGCPAWSPCRSAPSRRMSWMRKEVSGLDAAGREARGLQPAASASAPASGSRSRGSGARSIPAARSAAATFALRRPRALISGSAPRRLPIGRGDRAAPPIGHPALQVTPRRRPVLAWSSRAPPARGGSVLPSWPLRRPPRASLRPGSLSVLRAKTKVTCA